MMNNGIHKDGVCIMNDKIIVFPFSRRRIPFCLRNALKEGINIAANVL